MDVPDGPHRRKKGHGWNAVARAIVTDLAHLLPPRAPNCPGFLSRSYRYREDSSLTVDTYEGRWRDQQTGEGGTVFTLLVRLLGSWGAARRWLRENEYMHGLRPGPRREPGGSRGERQKRRSGKAVAVGEDRFWNPVRVQRNEETPCPAPAAADQLELWPEESHEKRFERNLKVAAQRKAEEERQWEAKMAKLSPAERNQAEAKRRKRQWRHGRVR